MEKMGTRTEFLLHYKVVHREYFNMPTASQYALLLKNIANHIFNNIK